MVVLTFIDFCLDWRHELALYWFVVLLQPSRYPTIERASRENRNDSYVYLRPGKGAKFLECRIILPDRPENLNFAPSFGYATIF